MTTRLVLGNLAAWSHGATIVYASEIFDPSAIVDAVVEERCTALHGVPTHFLGVLSEVDKRKAQGQTLDFSRLRFVFYTLLLSRKIHSLHRTGIAAGSPIPIELMQRLITQMNLRELTNAYGMSRHIFSLEFPQRHLHEGSQRKRALFRFKLSRKIQSRIGQRLSEEFIHMSEQSF